MDWKRIVILTLITTSIILAAEAVAQESQNVSRISQYYHNWNGGVIDVAIQGDYAYLACGDDGLRIVDMSSPGPRDAGQLVYQNAYAVAVSGSYAYIVNYNSLHIIDVADPYSPVEVDSVSGLGNISSVEMYGNHLFVCAEHNGLHIFDAATPSDLQLISTTNLNGGAVGIEIHGDMVAVASGLGGLNLLDISNLASPLLLGRFPTDGQYVLGASISGGYAYLAYGWNGFAVVDLSSMLQVAELANLTYAFRVKAAGDRAYLTYGDPECPLAVIDITNPLSPQTRGIYDPPQDIVNFDLAGSTVYVADFEHGLRMIDVSNPADPHESYVYSKFGHDYDVTIAGDNCIVREDYKLKIIDMSNPGQPAELGYYESIPLISDFELIGNIAFAASQAYNCLVSIDLSNPRAPVRLGTFRTPDNDVHYGIAYYDHCVYMLENYGIRIIDVSDPAAMVEAGYFHSSTSTLLMAVQGHYAFYQDNDRQLRMLDLTNPTAPVAFDGPVMAGLVPDVELVGNTLYVICSENLTIFDIGNPNDWVTLSVTPTYDEPFEYLREIEIQENIAYMAGYLSGLLAYDISDNANPTLAGYFQTPGEAHSIALNGDIAVVADFDNLGFYDCHLVTSIGEPSGPALPQSMALLPNYPNPFNGSTLIAFELPEQSQVKVTIMNINGQLIRTLFNDVYSAGSHTIGWDGRSQDGQEVSSGTYFYRLETHGKSESRRMVLLR